METSLPNSIVHEHRPDGPEACFGCKIQYMKHNGGMRVTTPVMRDGVSWWDTTYKEQQDILTSDAEHGDTATPIPMRQELI